MAAQLYCKTGEMAGSSFSLDREATIGRNAENDFQLASDHVSSQHARIFFDDEKKAYVIEDSGSRNGTQLDGVEISSPRPLDRLHVITFAGRFDFIFQVGDPAQPAGQQDAALSPEPATTEDPPSTEERPQTRVDQSAPPLPGALGDQAEDGSVEETRLAHDAPPMPRFDETPSVEKTRFAGDAPPLPNLEPGGSTGHDVAASSRSYELVVKGLESGDLVYELTSGEHVVGRSEECEICIEDASLSRKHAAILVTDRSITIRDLGSKNGTYVDDESAAASIEISPENTLKFGYRVDGRLKLKNA